MNPFRSNVFELCKSFIRLVLWLALAVNAGILAFFSILFVFHFTSFAWRYLLRTLFSGEWGVT